MNKNPEYNVLLATPFEDFEADVSCYPLYESIGELIERKNKKVFIPYRDIIKQWTDEELYFTVNKVIIPSAELVVGDIGMRDDGISSTAVGMMVASALQYSVPLIFFYKQGRKVKERLLNLVTNVPEVEYRTNEELLKKLETKFEEFF